MNKLTIFLKKGWIYLLILILTAMAILFLKTSPKNQNIPQAQPSVTPALKIASFGEITPGKTDLERVNELLGFPLKTEKENEKESSEYRTSNQYRNHQVISENNVVKLVKEIINLEDHRNAEAIRKIYGIAPEILYEQKPNSVFNLYVYPDNGIAYLGHEDGTLLEIWYFEPTSIDNFISRWAPGYAKEEYQGQSRY